MVSKSKRVLCLYLILTFFASIGAAEREWSFSNKERQEMTIMIKNIVSETDKKLKNDMFEAYHMDLIHSGKVSRMYLDKDYYFYKDIMPNEYIEVFLLSTEHKIEERLLLYSMMVVESGNFSDYINTNTDGSIDHGPLMLNSSNINSKEFRRLFFPSDEFLKELRNSDTNDIYISYIPACVNLLYAHLHMYKGDIRKSLRAYNGGPKVNRRSVSVYLDRKTERYYRKVNYVLIKISKKYEEFNKNSIDTRKMYLSLVRDNVI